ncbi:kinase-like protein [Byssothecium circinans]|uniref:Kinase-like protein n=1 Tax=Byssothecium circinans TaxID=147558 RepID=A0A6A5TCC5_9PLEO|nr:kinase-like protein [Byssothecium circinans]
MQSRNQALAEIQAQRKKLANSYKQLLDEFSAPDLKNVGNYALGRLIGKGSFGKVYLASHKLTNGSKVVLKSAKKDDTNLAREIHHHRQFIHPHIARLYEVIVTESLVWLVLEYCQGDELYNYLLNKGALEPSKVQKIFTQLVGAVSYVHNKSCVHRDLKLENILLDKHENVKLVDFGFTREYEGKSNYLQTWCGTMCYSAPEMLKGEKYAGEKVDVWSLGIILYALLVGELPFDDDNDMVTKTKILKEEPKYPESFPPQAKELCQILLSKRPILRPTLADILQNPWLSEHAPRQQEILKLQQPAPFSTELEKEVLHRMRAAGADIDMVIENVLAQRCDSLAGWWALLLEKEERKAKRRERKRKEREAEAKSLRRLSAASSRLDRLAPTIKEMEEEALHSPLLGEPSRSRGRALKRSSMHGAPDLPNLPESGNVPGAGADIPPPPIEKDHVRSSDSSSRPPPPPKEMARRRSQASMLQVVSSNPDLLHPNGFIPKRRRKLPAPFLNHLATIRNWIKETSKRARSPGGSKASSNKSPTLAESVPSESRPRRTSNANGNSSVHAHHANSTPSTHVLPYRRLSTHSSGKRPSVSPSPLTPRSSYRRSSGGLRGRKSTSSSVSSVRSMPRHHHSHSKASSTSSASITSPTTSHKTKSPHASVKVLPATPTNPTFPSNIRVVRGPLSEGGAAFGTMPPSSPGLIFAKRKRSPFKGPMLNLNFGGGSPAPRTRGEGGQGSRSTSVSGRRSGEIVGIEEEDEDEIEEVDDFSPVLEGGMEIVMEGETTAGAQTSTTAATAAAGEESGKLTLGPAFGDRLSVAVEEDEEDEEEKKPVKVPA